MTGSRSIPPLLLGALLLLRALVPATAAGQTATLDAGGRRVQSAHYTLDGSLAGWSGIATAATPAVVARLGYVGELYDVRSLSLSASSMHVPETGTSQLGAQALLDDSTRLALPASSVAWNVVSGPLAAISPTGLATAANVYQDALATVRGEYQTQTTTLDLKVVNQGNDDFGPYAQDGIDDAWQVQYFGLNNPNAGPAADPDRDGVANSLEYIADTDPTAASSYLRIQGTVEAAGCSVSFQSSARRLYTLYSSANVVSGPWTNLPALTDIPGSGGVDTFHDPAPIGAPRFYRLGVRIP